MKIVDLKVLVSCPGRNFVTLKVITNEGIYGLGDATVNGREMAVVEYLKEHIVPCLLGREAHQIEDIWQYLYRGAYWRKGPITMAAIAAVDMALWDIKGKVAGLPVYQLLGGRSRKGITAYGHANGETINETLDDLGSLIEKGFKVVRLQCAIPGLEGTYGTLGKKKDYYDLQSDRPLPPEQPWSTSKYMNFIPELFKQAREQYGYNVQLVHDVHNRLTPIEAAHLGKLLEPYKLMFLEDASNADNQDGYKLIREHTTIPLAIGETFNTIWDAKDLIVNQSIDYLRTSITHGGGITPLKKMANFAAIYHVGMAPHGAPDLSPICHAAHAHFNIWAPNFRVQEFIGFGSEKLNSVFKHPLTFEGGYIHLEDKPGLGVEYNEEEASNFIEKNVTLLIARRPNRAGDKVHGL